MKFDLTLIPMGEQERSGFRDGRVYARTREKSKIDLHLEKGYFFQIPRKKSVKRVIFLKC